MAVKGLSTIEKILVVEVLTNFHWVFFLMNLRRMERVGWIQPVFQLEKKGLLSPSKKL